jgi:hypothetical protein
MEAAAFTPDGLHLKRRETKTTRAVKPTGSQYLSRSGDEKAFLTISISASTTSYKKTIQLHALLKNYRRLKND